MSLRCTHWEGDATIDVWILQETKAERSWVKVVQEEKKEDEDKDKDGDEDEYKDGNED